MDVVGPLVQVLGAVALLAPSPAPGPWTATLDHLDVVRAAAFARRDPAALDDVYAPGSALAAEDAAVMGAWQARGLRLGPVRTRVLRASVVTQDVDRVVLDVVERLEPLRARTADGRWVELPRDGATQRRVVLTRAADRWRVAAVERVSG
ncbi:MAG: hypothetical protein Q7T56_08690 [Nocardioidaceae bacterium]|nr:hypothetical protein [Nocardioidaceae bacterium]